MKLRLLFLLAASTWLIPHIFAQTTTGTTQTPAANPGSAAQASLPGPASGIANSEPACPPVADRDWPVNRTIEARVTALMDSSHLKPGKTVFATVLFAINYAECSLSDGAIIYGHVTSAVSSKNPDSSELGLAFDHADCGSHDKQEVRLRLIGVVAPPAHGEMLHSALPSEVAGGVQQMQEASTSGIDEALSPEYYPRTVHPGLVVRLPRMKLEPEGGPGCSARISSSDHNIQLAPRTDLILTLERVTTPKK